MDHKDTRLDEVMAALTEGGAHADKNEAAEALEDYRRALHAAQKNGVVSGYIFWNVALAAERLGDLATAYEFVLKALEADPCALPYRKAFDGLGAQMLALLADPARDPRDEVTPRLYELLVSKSAADLPAHFAMTRHLLATGQLDRALNIAGALTVLYPAAREAWTALAEVHRAKSDLSAAAECSATAAALSPLQRPGENRVALA